MKIKYLAIIYLFGLLPSCINQHGEFKSINKEFHNKKVSFEESIKYVIILPEVGCGGCINEGVDFIKRNMEKLDCSNKEIKVIFTSINSMKLLLRALDIDTFDNYCFEIDKDNMYRINNPKSIYPLILYLKEGEIVSLEFQSPDHPNAFNKLERKLNPHL